MTFHLGVLKVQALSPALPWAKLDTRTRGWASEGCRQEKRVLCPHGFLHSPLSGRVLEKSHPPLQLTSEGHPPWQGLEMFGDLAAVKRISRFWRSQAMDAQPWASGPPGRVWLGMRGEGGFSKYRKQEALGLDTRKDFPRVSLEWSSLPHNLSWA